MEHTSHHPAITNYYIVSKTFKVTGYIIYNAEIKTNKLRMFYEGWCNIEWQDGSKLKMAMPMMQLGGVIMGSRDLMPVTCAIVFDEENLLKGVIKFGLDVKTGISSWFSSGKYDTYRGKIYKYNKKEHNKLLNDYNWIYNFF